MMMFVTIVSRTTIIRAPQDFHNLKMETGGADEFNNGFPVYV